jgi:hypothetical protein
MICARSTIGSGAGPLVRSQYAEAPALLRFSLVKEQILNCYLNSKFYCKVHMETSQCYVQTIMK